MPKIVVTKTRTTTPADTVAITEDTVPRTNPENRQKHRGPDEGHPRRSTHAATHLQLRRQATPRCSAVTSDPALPFSNPDLLCDLRLVLTDRLSVSIQLFPRPSDISTPILTTPHSNLDEFDDSSGYNAFPKRRLPSEHLISLANSAAKSAQRRQFIDQITNLTRTPAETLRNLNRSLSQVPKNHCSKGLLMRSLTGLALLVALSLSSAAVGNETPVHVLPATAAVKSVPVQPVAARRVTRSSKQTFFGKVMELERRKNAWLRRTFLGR